MARRAALPLVVAIPAIACGQAVPPSEEELRAQAKGSVPAVVTAGRIVSDVHASMNTVPDMIDAYTKSGYEKPLGAMGKAFDRAAIVTKLADGYYRGGSDGAWHAAGEIARDGVAQATVVIGGGAAAGFMAYDPEPVGKAAAFGYAVGSGIDALAGDWITQKMWAGQDAYYDWKDQYIDEPAREQWAEQLRARHRATKAQYEAEAAARAGAPAYLPVEPAPASSAAFDPVGLFIFSQQIQAMRPSASPSYTTSSPSSGSGGYYSGAAGSTAKPVSTVVPPNVSVGNSGWCPPNPSRETPCTQR